MDGKIWSFKTAQFEVFCAAEPEYDPDLSWADEETLRKLDNGEYVNICWHVGVIHNGHEIGSDYLGNSVYANPLDFTKEHLGCKHKGYGAYFSDMVRSAIADARKTLLTKTPVVTI